MKKRFFGFGNPAVVMAVLCALALAGCANSGGDDGPTGVNPPPKTQVPTPTNFAGTPLSAHKIAFTWDDVAGATQYWLYRATSLDGPYIKVETGYSTVWRTYESEYYVNPGVPTYFKISAVTLHSDESEKSAPITVTTNPPSPPSGIVVSPVAGAVNLQLTWTPVSGATKYTVYRGSSSNGTYYEEGTSTGASFLNDDGLSPNSTYYYKVTATSAGGESEKSDPVSGAAPSGLAYPIGLTREGATSRNIAFPGHTGAVQRVIKYFVQAQ